MIRTNLNAILKRGRINSYSIDATNLMPYVSESGLIQIPESKASISVIDFHVCIKESYSAGGRSESHTICGKGLRITAQDSPSTIFDPCGIPGAHCPCETNDDCPLWCQICDESPGKGKVCWNEHAESSCSSQPNFICVPADNEYGAVCMNQGDYYG